MKFKFFILLCSALFLSCKSAKIENTEQKMQQNKENFSSGFATIIYKTTKDYSDYVPVIMNTERTQIVSYPDPTDILYGGSFPKPTKLKNNYLLDNRGINENVAFLKYTYEAYSKLPMAPTQDIMLRNILDKYPLREMYFCGHRSDLHSDIKKYNDLIDQGFPNCKKAKIQTMELYFKSK